MSRTFLRALRFSSLSLSAALGLLLSSSASPKADDDHLTLYSTRDKELVEPLLEVFTQQTGVKVDLVFIENRLINRLKTEGSASPADLLMTIDFNNLVALEKAGLTQKIHSSLIDATVPANLRDPDDQWIALSLRPRVIVARTDLGLKALAYEELADPKWRGKICMRSALHKNNVALFSAFLLHHDMPSTEAWLQALKSSLARKPKGKDYDVIHDIADGTCDIGIANTNALAQLRAGRLGDDGKSWGAKVQALQSLFTGAGAHINVTGAAIAKNAPHPQTAIQFLEFIMKPEIQKLYAEADSEFPISEEVEKNSAVADLGSYKGDPLSQTKIDEKRPLVETMLKDMKFDD